MESDGIPSGPYESSLRRIRQLLDSRLIFVTDESFYFNLLVALLAEDIQPLDADMRDACHRACFALLSDFQLKEFDHWLDHNQVPADYLCAYAFAMTDPADMERKALELRPLVMRMRSIMHEVLRQRIRESALARMRKLLANRSVFETSENFYFNVFVALFASDLDRTDDQTREDCHTECFKLFTDQQLREFDEWLQNDMAPRDYRDARSFVVNFNDQAEIERKESELRPQFIRLHQLVRQLIQQRMSADRS